MMMRTLSTASLLCGCLALAACTITTSSSTPDGGTGSDTDSGTVTGDDGGTSTGNDGGSVTSGCGYGEPNESRDAATPIVIGTTYKGLCLTDRNDKDFYSFTTPADTTGGYVQIAAGNVGATGRIQIDVFTSDNNEHISGYYGESDGSTLNTWFSAAPGTSYRVEATLFNGESVTSYDLSLTYTKINDAYEPNDTRAAAKTITKGTTVTAYLYAGATAAEIPAAAYEDWYAVDLAVGQVTANVTGVTSDQRDVLEIVNSVGVKLGSQYSPDPGADAQVVAPVATAGTYYIHVYPFTNKLSEGKGAVVPVEVTTPYKLLVTQ